MINSWRQRVLSKQDLVQIVIFSSDAEQGFRLDYLEVALVPAVLGQRVPQLLVAPHRLQHVGRRLGLAARLAEK